MLFGLKIYKLFQIETETESPLPVLGAPATDTPQKDSRKTPDEKYELSDGRKIEGYSSEEEYLDKDQKGVAQVEVHESAETKKAEIPEGRRDLSDSDWDNESIKSDSSSSSTQSSSDKSDTARSSPSSPRRLTDVKEIDDDQDTEAKSDDIRGTGDGGTVTTDNNSTVAVAVSEVDKDNKQDDNEESFRKVTFESPNFMKPKPRSKSPESLEEAVANLVLDVSTEALMEDHMERIERESNFSLMSDEASANDRPQTPPRAVDELGSPDRHVRFERPKTAKDHRRLPTNLESDDEKESARDEDSKILIIDDDGRSSSSSSGSLSDSGTEKKSASDGGAEKSEQPAQQLPLQESLTLKHHFVIDSPVRYPRVEDPKFAAAEESDYQYVMADDSDVPTSTAQDSDAGESSAQESSTHNGRPVFIDSHSVPKTTELNAVSTTTTTTTSSTAGNSEITETVTVTETVTTPGEELHPKSPEKEKNSDTDSVKSQDKDSQKKEKHSDTDSENGHGKGKNHPKSPEKEKHSDTDSVKSHDKAESPKEKHSDTDSVRSHDDGKHHPGSPEKAKYSESESEREHYTEDSRSQGSHRSRSDSSSSSDGSACYQSTSRSTSEYSSEYSGTEQSSQTSSSPQHHRSTSQHSSSSPQHHSSSSPHGSLLSLHEHAVSLALSSIRLDQNKVKQICRHIEKNDQLEEVMLRNVELGELEMQRLAFSLKNSAGKIQVLDFERNDLDVIGVGKVMEVLKVKRTIEVLSLSGNPVGDEGIKVLVDGLLRIHGEEKQSQFIKKLALEESSTQVEAAGTSANQEGGDVERPRELEELLGEINELERKTKLIGEDDEDEGDAGKDMITRTIPTPEEKKSVTEFTEQLINTALQQAMESMSDMDISGQPSTRYMQTGGKSSSVDTGSTTNGDVSDEAFCHLQELDLREVQITDVGLGDLAVLLAQNTPLKCLNIGGNKTLTTFGWQRLAKGLEINQSLERLSLDHCPVGDDGMHVLTAAVQDNQSLRVLDLVCCELTEQGGCYLVDLLKRNTYITEINLMPGNDISDRTLGEIKNYLALNQNMLSSQ